MLRRSLFCVFLLTTYCLLNTTAAKAQVNDSTKAHLSDSAKTSTPDTTKPPLTDTIHAVMADTTHPGISIDPELMALSNSKNPPHEYTIAGIKISGTKYLDESLLTSISGLTVGDKVTIPGEA